MEIETQLKAGEATLLKEDRERWQQRTQDILQKCDRIEPAEMKAPKDKPHQLASPPEALKVRRLVPNVNERT